MNLYKTILTFNFNNRVPCVVKYRKIKCTLSVQNNKICNVIFCSPSLCLFDPKYSNIVKYIYYLK